MPVQAGGACLLPLELCVSQVASRLGLLRCGGALRPRMGINRVLAMFCGVRGDGDDGWLGCVEDGKSGFEMTLTL